MAVRGGAGTGHGRPLVQHLLRPLPGFGVLPSEASRSAKFKYVSDSVEAMVTAEQRLGLVLLPVSA